MKRIGPWATMFALSCSTLTLLTLTAACSGNIVGSLLKETPPAIAWEGVAADKPGNAPDKKREYRGSATVRIQICDMNAAGKRTCQPKRTYRRPVTVYTGAAASCDAVEEDNPFNLAIYTDQNPRKPLDGEFAIQSAASVIASYSGACALLQYWTLSLDGNTLTGELSEAHIDEGSAANIIWSTRTLVRGLDPMVLPSTIGEGTTLSGTIKTSDIRLHLEGGTTDLSRLFTADVVAKQVPKQVQ
ncbi:MAG: hypothetical protein M1546_22355 [Chloroflexi bacterium]|nr:hypothetical protein [Chloroflexota bacterium]